MTRTLCGLMLLFAIGCSQFTDGADAGAEPPTQSGPPVINLAMERDRRFMRAGHHATVATARFAAATIVSASPARASPRRGRINRAHARGRSTRTSFSRTTCGTRARGTSRTYEGIGVKGNS